MKKRNIKSFLALMLALALLVGTLSGCGSDASGTPDESSTATESSSEASAEGEDPSEDWVKAVGLTEKAEGTSAPDWTKYDELVNEVYADLDLEDREAKLHEAEDMLMATGAVVPLYYYNDIYLQNTSWTGIYTTPFGPKVFSYALKDGQPADVLKICQASEPAHLDPALNATVDGGVLAAHNFVGLYVIAEDNTIVPACADGDPEVSEDGTEYTIHLKQDLKWSDGSDLTANDFVYSWNRAVNPATASDYAYLFSVFEGYGDGTDPQLTLSAPDDYTITFKLVSPVPYMMNLLTFATFMPVPQASVEAADPDGTNPGAWAEEAGFIGNGAYTLQSWVHNESMVYVKNPYFYDADNVTVDELDFMLSGDDTAILAAYKSGDIDFADAVPTGEIPNLINGDDFHIVDSPGTYYVAFNVNSELFDGMTASQAAAMRRALGLLIDRQYIVDTIAQTGQKVATGFIPYGMSDSHGGEFKANDDAYSYPVGEGYYQDLSENEEGNRAQAQALLEYAGFKFNDDGTLSDETPISFDYLTNEGSGHEATAQAIQQDLATIGVTMTISTEDWQTFLSDRDTGNFDVARGGWSADYDDAINMIEMFLSSSGNNTSHLGQD